MAGHASSVSRLILALAYVLIFPMLLLLLSGDWLWIEGWIFSIWFVALCVMAIVYLYLRDPGLLEERFVKPGTASQKGWDRYVVAGLVVGFIAWVIIMPLDAKRFGWTAPFSLGAKVLGGIALLISSFLFFRSYTDNTFLSPLVRVQKDRNQQVVSTGVYGFVRHPMYLGAVLLFIGAPVLLGSLWGLIIGYALSLMLVARIVGEERMLTDELAGYAEYKERVRYRLIPFVW